MLIFFRLFKFYRKSGLSRRRAFARAWGKTWERA
jgi:hypothetical protein